VDWYRLRYADAPGESAEALLEWHLTRGQILGYSPNRFFDEAWQRRAWPGIMALIEAGSVASAFDAWCRGPHPTRAPHWLFDPREYRMRYPALTDEVLEETGFINRYHHYLRFGAAEGRIGHALFDPAVYLAGLDPAEAEAAKDMPFTHYLRGLETGAPERRTSPLFDPVWYSQRYPDAARSIVLGLYRSPLEHYLCNDRPTEYDPSPWFSESFYLAENPGLRDAIGAEGFRNGFAHFLAFGSREGRAPHPALDIAWYAARETVVADIAAERAADAFAHWITIGQPAGLPGRAPPNVQIDEARAVELYRRRAATLAPLFGRRKLDFSLDGPPALSVIMAIRDDLAATMMSLASLRRHYHDAIELILLDFGTGEAADIELQVTGAIILRFGGELDETAAREAGLICATADFVLLPGDGVDLAEGAIANALDRVKSDRAIGAVGGRLIQPHGTLLEAGGIVWRDGTLQAYARDESPLVAHANFARDADFCSTRFLLARRAVLVSLPASGEGLAGTTHDAADLCARIWRAGFRVVYEPDAVAFVTKAATDRRPDGQAAFVAAHADWLATRPAFDPGMTDPEAPDPGAIIRARSPHRGQTRVLFIEDRIPLRRMGSGFIRSNDILRAMAALAAWVTVFPLRDNLLPLSAVRAGIPGTIEVMHDANAAGLKDFIAARRGCFDLVWVARTHNLALVQEALAGPETTETPPVVDGEAAGVELAMTLEEQLRRLDPAQMVPPRIKEKAPAKAAIRVVVDTEALVSARRAEQAALFNQAFDLNAALREEFSHLTPAMHVVAVNEAEAAIIRPYHAGTVSVLGHGIAPSPTPRSFEERTGILFVGAIHGMDHPNYDGLMWFIEEVLPLIERALLWETRLTVAGYIAPGVTLDRFRDHPRVTLRGPMTDLVPLYDSNRVFVAPARFAAGIPYKVHEAAAHGLPAVATSLLGRQLGWGDADPIGIADVSDPAGFAARVIALHRDAPLWTRLREGALARVAAELDPAAFAARVAALTRSGG
jgi:glycosyltransferase involved in cell wall biosynthesis